MIFGRPANLWTGVATAVVGAVTVTLIALGFDAEVVGIIAGAWGSVIGVVILLIANQPPSVTQGDKINFTTPAGEPNVLAVVNSPNSLTPVRGQ